MASNSTVKMPKNGEGAYNYTFSCVSILEQASLYLGSGRDGGISEKGRNLFRKGQVVAVGLCIDSIMEETGWVGSGRFLSSYSTEPQTLRTAFQEVQGTVDGGI